jgi:hypothetical protein
MATGEELHLMGKKRNRNPYEKLKKRTRKIGRKQGVVMFHNPQEKTISKNSRK